MATVAYNPTLFRVIKRDVNRLITAFRKWENANILLYKNTIILLMIKTKYLYKYELYSI